MPEKRTRNLILVLGDQLDRESIALRAADPACDVIAMAEVTSEVFRHSNHRQRVAVFLAAMRHFRQDVERTGFDVVYQSLGAANAARSLPEFLEQAVRDRAPREIVLVKPGRHGLIGELGSAARYAGVPLRIVEDTSFLATDSDFGAWAEGRKTLVMEHFYRAMRRRHGYLLEGSEPEGGRWNFDRENRASFGRGGPGAVPRTASFPPDDITSAVLDEVRAMPELVGDARDLGWPVTPEQARHAVHDFVETRLADFGTHQDAMWAGEPFLYHSRIAVALNLKLIDPRYVIECAQDAYHEGTAPLNSVEGFVRQILGWREFLRGIYWREMPGYLGMNALHATRPLPDLFWTGETSMACMAEVVQQLLRWGYAHHIQRLMVTGLFALLYGADPRHVHEWFMAMHVDSVEWVTAPNTIGMSQYADGGIVGTKPYVATGKYIHRMSNYCSGCRYDPSTAAGETACPFTTLYWDFLTRHREALAKNRRMTLQVRNLDRLSEADRQSIKLRAQQIRQKARAGDL
jgi:deoxyribodipyrimidine photolyase-related protein